MATNIRFSDATTAFAMNSCWPLKPDHVHPIVSKLSFRYHEVPGLERLIGKVQRCQEDEAFRQTPKIAEIRPLLSRLEELEDLLQTIKVDRQSDWQAADRIAAFEKNSCSRQQAAASMRFITSCPKNCEVRLSLHTTATTIRP